MFCLWYTLVRTEKTGAVFLTLAESRSRNLNDWSAPRVLTPKDPTLSCSSPGNLVRRNNRWVLCLQTYPRPRGKKYADETARVFKMESDDLDNGGEPKVMRFKGEVPFSE